MRTLIEVDRLIDGTGSQPMEKASLLIEGERILAVGRQADIGRPEGAYVHEAPAGATLIPGMMDSHVHITYGGKGGRPALRLDRVSLSYTQMGLRAAGNAITCLVHGLTGLRDLNGPGNVAIDLRDAIDAGQIVGPRLKACGHGLATTGGHQDLDKFARQVGGVDDLANRCDGAYAFRRGVREELKRGADFIKITANVGAKSEPGVWSRAEMSAEEIRAACDEAHLRGVKVASHMAGGDPTIEALENGVDMIEHGHWLDDATIEVMVKKGTYYIPTLLVNERNFEIPLQEQGLKRYSDWALASRDAKWASLERARKAGIKVGAGTDAGFMVPHGSMSWREIELLVQGGYSAVEAIACATGVNAEIMGTNAGILAEGRLSDFVVIEGDPVAELSLLGNAQKMEVFKGGTRVARHGMLAEPLGN